MTKNTIIALLGIGSAASALSSAALAYKVRKLTKKIGMAFKDFEDQKKEAISDVMLERCCQRAADNAAEKYAKSASSAALNSVQSEVKSQVKKATEQALEDVEKAVSDEITRQVADIDPKHLQKKVSEQAERKILDKFDRALDTKLDEFDDKLDDKMSTFTGKLNTLINDASGNIGLLKKIHNQISEALSDSDRDNGKEIRLRVG